MSDLTGNFFLHNSRGKLAGAVLGVRKGRTIMRENVKPSNPQTYAQMVRRVKWGNLVNVHRILAQAGLMANAWEGKPNKWTDYNAMMSANPCDENNLNWLEKEEAKAGEIKANSAIKVASGSLGFIPSTFDATTDGFETPIQVSAEDFESFSTYGELAASILALNSTLIDGDELTAYSILQTISQEGKVSHNVKIETFTLDSTNTDEFDTEATMFSYKEETNILEFGRYGNIGATETEFCALVVSRKTDTGVKVSTSILGKRGYSNPGSLSDAIESYSGEEAAAFLDPTN